jgi:hypothetical protein
MGGGRHVQKTLIQQENLHNNNKEKRSLPSTSWIIEKRIDFCGFDITFKN